MNQQLQYPAWSFPSNDSGQISGISDNGVETFRGTPMKSLAREICQNSLDAVINPDLPVVVDFHSYTIMPYQIPGYAELKRAMEKCLDFWQMQKSDNKAVKFFEKALQVLNSSQPISCLRISDFNTTGLTGSDSNSYQSTWNYLIKSSGASDKLSSSGGSFGIGKFAPFACSDLRTVIYSTYDKDSKEAYQGVARLTSFELSKENLTQGIGYFGGPKNTPVRGIQYNGHPGFSRDENQTGTDLFILGFTADLGWETKMICSVLDGFLYSVYQGKLAVKVNDTLINQDTLSQLIGTYKNDFSEHADQYYDALTNQEENQVTETTVDIKGAKGNLKLSLIIKPEYCRRTAMVRQTGMKIEDKGKISGLIPFAGVLYIQGDELNAFLRQLENPEHVKWQVDRAENKSKANNVLKAMRQFILKSLNEMKEKDSGEELDPDVGEYLGMEDSEESLHWEEDITDKIDFITVKTRKITPIENIQENPPHKEAITSKGNSEESENGGLEEGQTGGTGGTDTEKGLGEGTGSGGSGGKDQPGQTDTIGSSGGSITRTGRTGPISLKARFVVQNKAEGKYLALITPSSSSPDAAVEFKISAEKDSYDVTVKSAVLEDGTPLTCSGNKVKGLVFQKDEKLRLFITLDFHDYCSLEVKANGYKS